ncbi:Uncharacterised protein [BD1-7 clade bacterium]|uniref:Endonuclease/exonuclease/phosphatase domain-containing protein n=1 Tax=BD1-7 clade bacterium TaxID=2029982 RepID=A0A5S9Q6T2_9GAMM|nr:Uncharacterised protein [BD1-7 clade bacterium]CAA0114328.1 Uncharacterised protein [BD1-7 clade bacterium]
MKFLKGMLLASASVGAQAELIINEFDADQPSSDTAEFVEIFDGGAGNTSLDGHVIVLYNGSDDASYDAIDLDGFSTNADGYFVLCSDSATVANCQLDTLSQLQNGPDAIALYQGSATSFGNDTAITSANLIDAVVYGTNDSDDAGLLIMLNAGQPQVNDATSTSAQRCVNGSGGALNTDTYTSAIPTPGAANACAGGGNGDGTTDLGSCGDAAQLISGIQGNITNITADTSPLVGQPVVVEALVTADFTKIDNDNQRYNGFWIQEEESDYDANDMTSEGIFVYSNDIAVSVGDLVRLKAQVDEFGQQTQLKTVSDSTVCSSGNSLPTQQNITLPVSDLLDFEAIEGMRVSYGQGLIVSDLFGSGYGFGNFGQFGVSSKLHFQPTEIAEPESIEAAAAAELRTRDFVLVDDGVSAKNPAFIPFPDASGFSALNPMRIGYTVPTVDGVMHGFNAFRIVVPTDITIVPSLPRTAEPEVAADANLVVVGMNVLNYFNGDGNGSGFREDLSGDAKSAFRGAETYDAFQMQEAKIVAAIQATDADIVGLMELENDGFDADSSVADLVEALNAGQPSEDHYRLVDPGTAKIGDDAIVVGLIYRADKVSLKGDAVVLDETNSPTDANGVLFNTDKNRPALIQSFDFQGNVLTVAVNHLKSKGSACGEPNEGADGQANCNIMRTRAAKGLAQFLATDPTASSSDSVMILGDLNAYSKEDPMDELEAAGYTNLKYTDKATEVQPYSFSFSGFLGSLDHALVKGSLLGNVVSVDAWHINSVEDTLMDYYTEANGHPFDSVDNYANADAYRSSDHDPIVVGLKFDDNSEPDPKPQPPKFGAFMPFMLLLMAGFAAVRRKR